MFLQFAALALVSFALGFYLGVPGVLLSGVLSLALGYYRWPK